MNDQKASVTNKQMVFVNKYFACQNFKYFKWQCLIFLKKPRIHILEYLFKECDILVHIPM